MKILVVDDEATSRTILITNLERWGYHVFTASDGEDGWNTYQKYTDIAFIVLDWIMPKLNGIELCQRIREYELSEKRRKSYIIILTGKSERRDLVAGLDAGADDYIVKPNFRDELRARIKVGVRTLALEDKLSSRIHELEVALDHVKQLQGLLPICAYCKRVRDESDYWHQVEAYLSKHSKLVFSHGICPDCLNKHFPELSKS